MEQRSCEAQCLLLYSDLMPQTTAPITTSTIRSTSAAIHNERVCPTRASMGSNTRPRTNTPTPPQSAPMPAPKPSARPHVAPAPLPKSASNAEPQTTSRRPAIALCHPDSRVVALGAPIRGAIPLPSPAVLLTASHSKYMITCILACIGRPVNLSRHPPAQSDPGALMGNVP